MNTNGVPVVISNSQIMSNTALGYWESVGGGLSVYGPLLLDHVALGRNRAVLGGGISQAFAVDFSLQAPIVINASVVAGNTALGYGGSAGYGGGIAATREMTISASAIVGNAALAGAGIYTESQLDMFNTTLGGNVSTGAGGGLAVSGGGDVRLGNVTIHDNQAADGAGVWVNLTSTLSAQNTLLEDNLNQADDPADCSGTITSDGYNLIGSLSFCSLVGQSVGNLVNIDSLLFPLINDGGPTPTYPLLVGSPAINHGNPSGCRDGVGNLLAADQRGVSRVGQCDIGAYEYDASHTLIRSIYLPNLANMPAP